MPIYKFTLPEVATDWVITITDGSGGVVDTIGVGASSGSVSTVSASGNRLVISADLPVGEYRASSADVDSWGRRDFVTSGVLDIPATLDALPGTIVSVVEGMEIGGQNIRLDALAAGQRLKANLTGNESESAVGVTVGTMVAHVAASPASLGTVTLTDTGNIVTTSAAHGLVVGDAVVLGTITTTTGISSGVIYYVRTVPTSTTMTLTTAPGGGELNFTTDGTAVAIWRRERGYKRETSVVNTAFRCTATRAIQASASYPRYDYIKGDASIVTYAPGSLVGTGLTIETEYSGKYLDLVLRYSGSTNPVRVYVDGRLAATVAQATFTGAGISSGSLGRLPLTFADYRKRTITVRLSYNNDEFPGFDTEGAYPVGYPVASSKGARILVVGDSFTEGTGAGTSRSYAEWLADLMGWRDLWKAGSGSTGYTESGSRASLISRYTNDIVAQQAQVVIIAMGLNDAGQTLATVVANATTIWDATLASSYTRELVIVGPWPNGGGAGAISAPLLALDAALAALAVEKGVRYISPISEGWQFTLSDSTHPNAAGHEYIAWRLAGHLSVPYIAA